MGLWNQQPFEDLLEKKLKEKLGIDPGKAFFNRYTQARDYLIDNVYSEIPASAPHHTKHDASHVKEVLNRVYRLLDEDINTLSCFELYALGIIVLFHDVGNLSDRKDHQLKQRVAGYYNKARGGDDPKWRQERHIILTAVEAHTGKDEEGNIKDTLKDVPESSNLENGEKVRLRDLAAILRFGDECEEGPHRTSQVRQDKAGTPGGYDVSSMKYHEFANIMNVFIDRGSERVVMTCHLNYDTKEDRKAENLRKLLTFTYERIIKLDEERKYARYYSTLLIPFKKTEVTFHFSVDGIPIDDIIPKSIELKDDVPVPGKKADAAVTCIEKQFPDYALNKILTTIKKEGQK